MSKYVLRLLHFNDHPVLVWMRGNTPHLETQHLSRLLGYVQAGSLRKQMFSDWKGEFLHDRDYVIVREEDELRAYEEAELLHNDIDKHASLERGRVFLTPCGVGRILERSTKTTEEFKTFLGLKVFGGEEIARFISSSQQELFDPSSTSKESSLPRERGVSTPPLIGTSRTSSTSETLEPNTQGADHKFQYEAIQTLLHNLKEHQEPALRELAVEAAELALGRRLDDIRKKFLGQKKPPPPRKTEGPLFEEEGWYSFTQMGELAGAYSAPLAGKAATIVAERWGFSGTDIRRRRLHFNTFVSRKINGRVRRWPKFNRAFSNEVVCELRSNELLTPRKTPAAKDQLAASRSYVDLTKGPFDEEDQQSEAMENFLETLEGERPAQSH